MTTKIYEMMLSQWEYVDDCYKGVIAIKSPEKQHIYLPKFPVEARNPAKDPQYQLRCWSADYDNIFKSAIMSMVGVMGKIPAKIEFGNAIQEVRDLDMWGNKYDDRLIGLKARLNHAQTLFGRYGLLLDVLTDHNGQNPHFCIQEFSCYKILDGETYKSPFDGKERLRWIKLDTSKWVFNYETKRREFKRQFAILGLDAQYRYYRAFIEGDDIQTRWQNFDILNPDNVHYPIFKGTHLNFIPFTICNVDRLGIDEWQEPPFLDMAYSTINAYNADSLYKQAMINHATPTLVVLNAKMSNDMTLGGVMSLIGEDGAKGADVRMMETNAGGLAELGRCAKSIKEEAMRRTIFGMLESVGANTSGTAITLRTAAGTATIGEIDRAGARAIEEQLCFAAVWSGMSWKEAGDNIGYEVDTSYMASQGTVQEFVSLMGANLSMGAPFLSRQNLYSIIQKLHPNTLTEWEINELQKEEEAVSLSPQVQILDGLSTVAGQAGNLGYGQLEQDSLEKAREMEKKFGMEANNGETAA